VGELDDGMEVRGEGDDLAVAEGPMISASCTGAGGADEGSPEDDEDVAGDYGPGETG
jgi:hypothetical protein